MTTHNQSFTSRQVKFMARKLSKLKVGQNAFVNRSCIVNNKIPLTWFKSGVEKVKKSISFMKPSEKNINVC